MTSTTTTSSWAAMPPNATGLLSLQAELQQRRQRTQQHASGSSDATAGSSSSARAEYSVKAFKGNKLSTDFTMPKEGINYNDGVVIPKSKRIKPLDIDKYTVKGRGPNVSLLSESAKTPSAKLEAERLRVLRAKAKAYESLAKGQDHSEIDQGDEGILIDFKRKAAEQGGSPDEEDEDPDARRASFFENGYQEKEEEVEYVDELGRSRRAPRSQVPKELWPENDPRWYPSVDSAVTYGRQQAFPVYRPPSPKLRTARALRSQIESGAPPLQHFDSTAEVRNRGAGLFKFSKDEKERGEQMEALLRERRRTELERRERRGESEGSDAKAGPSTSAQAQTAGFGTVEDRPWGLEGDDHEEGALAPAAYDEDEAAASRSLHRDGDPEDPFAAVERQQRGGPSTSSNSEPLDPFAAVEAAVRSESTASSEHGTKARKRRRQD